jgi:hypothetical protein
MKTQREPEVPATWRDAMGLHPDLEAAQPGHAKYSVVLYLVMVFGCAALVYGIARGF